MPFVKRVNTRGAERLLTALEEIGQRCVKLEADLDSARHYRDELVTRASKAGATRRDVAAAAKLSAGRVQQLTQPAPQR